MTKKQLHMNIIYAFTGTNNIDESINVLKRVGIFVNKNEPFKNVLNKIYEIW